MMAVGGELKTMVGMIAAILVGAAAYLAASVFAPLALALFIIAMVWPLQRWLQSRIPKFGALVITLVITVTVCLSFTTLAIWGFGRVGRLLVTDAARFQSLYDNAVSWLEVHGISISGVWTEHFNVAWMLRTIQQVTGRVNTTLTFWIVTLVYVILGLLEVDDIRRKIQSLDNPEAARVLTDGSVAIAAKFRKYLWVRTQMSIMTGLLVWAFAWMTGLQLAAEWGVIAFALNYIPLIGPFIATVLPTVIAAAQFGSWEAVLGIFICLNIIQFVVGSNIEPRVAGTTLSISPTVVLFSVFLWTFLWGLFGAFIGVPITLAILTYCEQHPASRWLARLLGAPLRALSDSKT
jgi:AI-2 transport protein TqsA